MENNYITNMVKDFGFSLDNTKAVLLAETVYEDGFEDGVNEVQSETLKIQLDTCKAICKLWELPDSDRKYLQKYFKDIQTRPWKA